MLIKKVTGFVQAHDVAIHRVMAGLCLAGAITAFGLHIAQSNLTGPAYDHDNPAHKKIAQQFAAACAPDRVSPDRIKQAFNEYLQTGRNPVINLDASGFNTCIAGKVEHKLAVSSPSHAWMETTRNISLGVFVLTTALGIGFGAGHRRPDHPGPV